MSNDIASTPHFTTAVSLARYIIFYVPQRGNYKDLCERVDIGLDQSDIDARIAIPPDAVAYEVFQRYQTEKTKAFPQLTGPQETLVPYTFIDPQPMTAAEIEAHTFSMNAQDNSAAVEDFLNRLKRQRVVCRRRDGLIFSGDQVPFYDTGTGQRGEWVRRHGVPVRKFQRGS